VPLLPRSKLEAYEDIINALSQHALTIDEAAYNCNMDCTNLQQRLTFLVKNNLAEIEVSRDNKIYYVITPRGLTIAKTLAVTKRLEKLQTTKEHATANYMRIQAQTERSEEETANVI
jgi:predicted transcriptional regulator